MILIRKIEFEGHPILKNLKLNFCNSFGKPVKTVIFAGENGTGKSTIVNELYKITLGKVDFEAKVEIEIDKKVFNLKYYFEKMEGKSYIWMEDGEGLKALQNSNDFREKYLFNGIFSDVDINFETQNIKSVTSMVLDGENTSRRSNQAMPNQIKQLLIDVQALDDADLSLLYRELRKNGNDTNGIVIEERMPRFIKAFNMMFGHLKYSHIANINGYKEIIFKKNNISIPISSLSSGEKQIIFRGGFLLKDVNAIKGAVVFIDEPEISLHPSWQKKIIDYYKRIFSDKLGEQTSQIFVVTHSPFIIHNDMRKDDKVIILDRDGDGDILISDKMEYYNCNSIEAIKDAFSIDYMYQDEEKPVVYVEGRTDEMYFNKALEVYDYRDMPFQFKWVGYVDENGKEYNTGKDSLNKAAEFLKANNYSHKNICLSDCDTRKKTIEKNNVICKAISHYENSKNIIKGIENALVLDEVDIELFYSCKKKTGDYGNICLIGEFNKMECCNEICKMSKEDLKKVFINLKKEIDELLRDIK